MSLGFATNSGLRISSEAEGATLFSQHAVSEWGSKTESKWFRMRAALNRLTCQVLARPIAVGSML